MDCKKWLGAATPAVFVTTHLLDVLPLVRLGQLSTVWNGLEHPGPGLTNLCTPVRRPT
jgi:hypothetical protein